MEGVRPVGMTLEGVRSVGMTMEGVRPVGMTLEGGRPVGVSPGRLRFGEAPATRFSGAGSPWFWYHRGAF